MNTKEKLHFENLGNFITNIRLILNNLSEELELLYEYEESREIAITVPTRRIVQQAPEKNKKNVLGVFNLSDLFVSDRKSATTMPANRNKNKFIDSRKTLGNQEGGEMPKKLRHGTIRKRTRKNKNGTIINFFEGRYMENGSQKSVYGKTYAECLEKLKIAIYEEETAPKKDKLAPMPFGEWLQKWYDTYKKPFLKPRSLLSLSACISKHISEEIKLRRIDKITQIDLQECINSVIFPRQKDIVYQIIVASMKQAKINGVIKTEPWLGLVYKKSQSTSHSILTYKQEEAILKEATPIMKRLILGYIWTGCRLRELLSIKWQDIDFETNRLTIRGTKSNGSNRTIPLFDAFKEVIGTPGEQQAIVFPYNGDWVSHNFHDLVEKLGFENISIHSLRHTFASRMRAMEIDPKSIQMMLGHSSIQTTMDIYVHSIEEYEETVRDKVNAFSSKSTLKKDDKYPKK